MGTEILIPGRVVIGNRAVRIGRPPFSKTNPIVCCKSRNSVYSFAAKLDLPVWEMSRATSPLQAWTDELDAWRERNREGGA